MHSTLSLCACLAMTAAVASGQIRDDRVLLTVNQKGGMPVAEFLKVTKIYTGATVRFAEADVRGKRVRFSGSANLDRGDGFTRFVQTMLYRLDLECTPRRNGEELRLDVAPRKSEDWKVSPDPSAIYKTGALKEHRLGRDKRTVVVTSMPLTKHARALLEIHRKRPIPDLEIGLPADGKSFIAQGTGTAISVAQGILEGLATPWRRVATTSGVLNGPTWDPVGKHLLFSDTANDAILRLGSDGKTTPFRRAAGQTIGLRHDSSGNLYACQGRYRKVVRIDRSGSETVLASRFDGKKLNSTNSLALDDFGGLYFTDPRFGLDDDIEQRAMGVYYLAFDGTVKLVIDDLRRPKGIAVSPGGSTLFVAEAYRRQIRSYPILAPGSVGDGKVVFQSDPVLDGPGPDGITLDEKGRIYAAYRNLIVLKFSQVVRRFHLPETPTGCAFGGADGRTLFVTAGKSVYSTTMKTKGLPPRSTTGRLTVWPWVFFRMVPRSTVAASVFGGNSRQILSWFFDARDLARLDEGTKRQNLRATLGALEEEVDARFAMLIGPNTRSEKDDELFPTKTRKRRHVWAVVLRLAGRTRSEAFPRVVKILRQNPQVFGIARTKALELEDTEHKAWEMAIETVPGTGCLALGSFGQQLVISNSSEFLKAVGRASTAKEPEQIATPVPREDRSRDGDPWIHDHRMRQLLGEKLGAKTAETLERGSLYAWLLFAFGG